METGLLKAITLEGMQGFPPQEGREVVSRQGDVLTFYPIAGGQPRRVKAQIPNINLPLSDQTGRYVIGAEQQEVPLRLYRPAGTLS
jgi:hypothetical protein